MADGGATYNAQATERSVLDALLWAKGTYGGAKTAIIDGDERALSYNDISRARFRTPAARSSGRPDPVTPSASCSPPASDR